MRTPVAVVALAVLALTGCTQTPSPVSPGSFVGEPLDELTDRLDTDVTLLIQDASPRVGAAPSYSGDPDRDAGWTIAAICASAADVLASGSVEAAVIPADSVTARVRSEIAAGDYRDSVDCEGRPHHG